MSTKRRRASPPAPPSTTTPPGRSLPDDILLEIAAHADAKTLVRFAATSKPLRRGILNGPDFRRRLLAVRAAATDLPFDPDLLRGVAYTGASAHVDQAPPRLRVGIIDPYLLDQHGNPWASRDGFLVMWCLEPHDEQPPDVCVYDAVAGSVTCLPPMSLDPRRRHYTPALLAVDHGAGGGRAYELLVATRHLDFQTFSSKTGQWGAVRGVSQPVPRWPVQHRAHPAVVGRTVHWLMVLAGWQQRILALDVDAGTATTMQFPEGCTVFRTGKDVVPVAVGGRLGVIVVESHEVSMWVWTTTIPASAPAWSRQLVIRSPEIQWQAGQDVDSFRGFLLLGGFGERSGAVILQLKNGDLVRLDLGTKEVTSLSKGRQEISFVCLHEIDLASLVQTMKKF